MNKAQVIETIGEHIARQSRLISVITSLPDGVPNQVKLDAWDNTITLSMPMNLELFAKTRKALASEWSAVGQPSMSGSTQVRNYVRTIDFDEDKIHTWEYYDTPILHIHLRAGNLSEDDTCHLEVTAERWVEGYTHKEYRVVCNG